MSHARHCSFLAAFLLACCLTISCNEEGRKFSGPLEKMRLACATPPYTVLTDIALAEGFFRDEGLDVTPVFHIAGKSALNDMMKGTADVATVAETPFMLAVMNGNEISLIATIQYSSRYNAIVARKDRGIRAPADLKGKTITTPVGTTSDFFLDAFLAVHGISRQEVKVMELGPEKIAEALSKGEVDAASVFQSFLVQAQKRLGEKGITFYDEEIYTQTFNIAAGKDYIRSNQGKIRKLIRGLIRAEQFAANHPAEAQKRVTEYRRADKDMLGTLWDGNVFSVVLDQSLIFSLEDESRWAIDKGLTGNRQVPDYLDYIYLDGLASVRPKAVRIVR